MIVAFEGIDGSGKGTQARLTYDWLIKLEIPTVLFSFPRYTEGVFGPLVRKYLAGDFGDMTSNHPLLTALLYSCDRLGARDALHHEHHHEGAIVLCDRYVASNCAHQAAKLPGDIYPPAVWDLINQIEQIEYGEFKLPLPTLQILLDISVDEAVARRKLRNDKGDLHENDIAYLGRVAALYCWLPKQRPFWQPIVAGDTRSIHDVQADVRLAIVGACERFRYPHYNQFPEEIRLRAMR